MWDEWRPLSVLCGVTVLWLCVLHAADKLARLAVAGAMKYNCGLLPQSTHSCAASVDCSRVWHRERGKEVCLHCRTFYLMQRSREASLDCRCGCTTCSCLGCSAAGWLCLACSAFQLALAIAAMRSNASCTPCPVAADVSTCCTPHSAATASPAARSTSRPGASTSSGHQHPRDVAASLVHLRVLHVRLQPAASVVQAFLSSDIVRDHQA